MKRFLGLALFAAACGGDGSMASKSAAAYRETQAAATHAEQGHARAEHDHSGHETTIGEAPPMDHSAHGTMSAHDHAAMGHTAPASGGHAHHDHHAAMQHTPATEDAPMDHSQHQHHGHHAAMPSTTSAPVAPMDPLSSAEVQAVQPAATLRPDAFDAPAATSVSEAEKGRKQ